MEGIASFRKNWATSIYSLHRYPNINIRYNLTLFFNVFSAYICIQLTSTFLSSKFIFKNPPLLKSLIILGICVFLLRQLKKVIIFFNLYICGDCILYFYMMEKVYHTTYLIRQNIIIFRRMTDRSWQKRRASEYISSLVLDPMLN